MVYLSYIIGRYFYEATVTDEGLCRVGWSTDKGTLDLGTDKFGFGFGGTGKKSSGRQFDSYGEVTTRLKVSSHSLFKELSARKTFLFSYL